MFVVSRSGVLHSVTLLQLTTNHLATHSVHSTHWPKVYVLTLTIVRLYTTQPKLILSSLLYLISDLYDLDPPTASVMDEENM